MTNNEILHSDLLDILFEHRNKLYGAYALRKNYTHRLGTALGIALSAALLFVLMFFVNKNKKGSNSLNNDPVVQLTEVDIPKPDEPEPPEKKPIVKPPQAQVNYQTFVVVADEKADTIIASVDDIINADIGKENIDGDKPTDLAKPASESDGIVHDKDQTSGKENEKFIPSRNPEFPGGTAAWLAFLQRYLHSPEDLEPGQRVEVLVRFFIDVDGSVSKPEIIKSGGASFDKEVLRVMKKMPRWEPAIQGGNFVAVPYTQPVIFIGAEQ